MKNNLSSKKTINSREVAKMVGKEHKHLLRDIKNYIQYLDESKIGPSDFFIESAYKNTQNKTQPCYEITKMGCEMIANKLTGKKGILFTATYVKKFNEMEESQNKPKVDTNDKLKIQEMNAKTRMANMYLKLSNVETLSKEYKNILVSKATEVLSGEELLPLPKSEQKTYSATEIGNMFGVSSNRIGKLANANNLKTEEYGEWYRSKSEHSSKEVDTFKYYDSAIPKFKELLKTNLVLI